MPLPPDAVPVNRVRPKNLPADAVPVGGGEGNQQGIRIEGPAPLVAGRYKPDDLARKMIPQFTKGLAESNLPGAKAIGNMTPRSRELMAGTPEPQGMLPYLARLGGKIGPDFAMMSPFVAEAQAAPMLQQMPNLVRLALGVGGYEGAKEVWQGTPQNAPKEAGIGALSTLAIGAPLEGLAKVAEPAAGRVMNAVLKPAKQELSRGKNLGLKAAKAGYWGTKKRLLSKASENLDIFENELQGVLQKSTKSADVNGIYQRLEALKKNYFGNQAAVNAIDDMKRAVAAEVGQAGILPLARANEIKRSLYGQVKPSQFNNPEVPHLAEIRKTAARVLKEAIEKAEPSVRGINQKIGTAGAVKDAVENRLAVEMKKEVFSVLRGSAELTTFLAGAFGVGGPVSPLILAGSLGQRILNSDSFRTKLAQELLKFSEASGGRKAVTVGAATLAHRLLDYSKNNV